VGQSLIETQTRHVPGGKLCLRAYSPYGVATWKRDWRESQAGEIGSICDGAVQELEREAPQIAKLFAEGDRRNREEKRKIKEQLRTMKREEAARRRAQAAEKGRDELLGIIEEWGLATRIEAFFKNVEKRSRALAKEERAAILGRIEQARTLIGGSDALRQFRSWNPPAIPKDDSEADPFEDDEF